MTERSPETGISQVLPLAAKQVAEKVRGLIASGRAREALLCLAEFDGIGSDSLEVVKLTKAGLLIDLASKLDDADLARKGVSLMKEVGEDGLSQETKHTYLYNLGNGYGALYDLKRIPKGVQRSIDEDFRSAKKCYQRAMSLRGKSTESTSRLYTNYGILLRDVGRHVEEIEAYDDALKATPNFGMALWNKAGGLCWYSNLVDPPTKRSALVEARHLLKLTLKAGLQAARQAKVKEEIAKLDRVLGKPKAPAHRHTHHVAYSAIERKYIKFCVANRLYLHPCPVTTHEAYRDTLSVRIPTPEPDEYLELRSSALALIKQEYIAARLLLFAYRCHAPDLSFVDTGTFLPSVEDRKGQIYVQLLIFSFRAAYSTLDKIGYFLNDFCRLGDKSDSVRFQEELFVKKGSLRQGLRKYDGTQLSALFDLAREFSKEQPLFSLRDLRNKLEHRCLALRRPPTEGEAKTSIEGDAHSRPAVYDLNEDDLYEGSLRLFKAVRAAIFYTFYFTRTSIQERIKELRREAEVGST